MSISPLPVFPTYYSVPTALSYSVKKGGYSGASKKRTFGKGYNPSNSSSDVSDLLHLPILRDRSHDLYRNNALANGVIDTNVINIVGSGLVHNCDIDHDFLGLSEDEAELWEKDVERKFKLWAESKECDTYNTSNFYDLQEIALHSMLVGGDVLALFPYIKRSLPYGLTVKLLEADHLCNPNDKKDDERIAGGVEVDENQAPKNYHLLEQHPGGNAKKKNWIIVPAFSKNGRRNLLHLYKVIRPGQKRGIPELAPIIEILKQIDNYIDAEMTAAVVSAMFTVFIEDEDGEPLGDDQNFSLGNGSVVGSDAGQKVSFANPSRPNSNFDGFLKTLSLQISTATQIPYEVLMKHFTSSYSASRGALNEAWKYFRTRRAFFVDNFCQIIKEMWLDEAVAIGDVEAVGYFDDALIKKAWSKSVWNGPVPGQLNEVAETRASVMRIDNGLSNHERESHQINGTDHRTNVKKFKREKNIMQDAGYKKYKEEKTV